MPRSTPLLAVALFSVAAMLPACAQPGDDCENTDSNGTEMQCSGKDALVCQDGTWEVSDSCSCNLLGEMMCVLAEE